MNVPSPPESATTDPKRTPACRAWSLLRALIATVLVGSSALGLATSQAIAGTPDTAPTVHEGAREKVVVIHGLGRSRVAMWPLARRLDAAGFEVTTVGYDSLGSTVEQALAEVVAQIDGCCTSSETPVHFVGHSLGGLLIRAYLADHPLPQLGRVVMLGTPNQGTPVVDRNHDTWWMQLAGPLANCKRPAIPS